MKTKNTFMMAIGVLLAFSLVGCATYGKIVPESVSGGTMTVAALEENWQDYNVYAAPMDAAIIFARKGEMNTLQLTNHWTKLTDQDSMLSSVRNIQAQPNLGVYRPTLWKIMGPNGRFYGYMFTAWDQEHVIMKKLGENKLLVYGMTQPPYIQEENGPGMRHGM